MCIHIKYNKRPLCRPISFDFLHVSLFWILRVTYISYANCPVSLLPFLPVYGVSNGLLFGISGYRWIEILISLNNYNISKSTYPRSWFTICRCLFNGCNVAKTSCTTGHLTFFKRGQLAGCWWTNWCLSTRGHQQRAGWPVAHGVKIRLYP